MLEHIYIYTHVHASHTYTYSYTCTHTKIASKFKRNAKYFSRQSFCQSSKPARSSDPLDGQFMKATTRTAYRGSRSPSFPEWQEFSPLSDNPERETKVEVENLFGSSPKGQSSYPANRESSSSTCLLGHGREASRSTSTGFFCFPSSSCSHFEPHKKSRTCFPLSAVVSMSWHSSLFSAHCRMEICLTGN